MGILNVNWSNGETQDPHSIAFLKLANETYYYDLSAAIRTKTKKNVSDAFIGQTETEYTQNLAKHDGATFEPNATIIFTKNTRRTLSNNFIETEIVW